MADRRPDAQRPTPHNKLTKKERGDIISIVNSERYKSRPPSQIVPALADEGTYVASESTMYRILKEESQQHPRGRQQERTCRPISTHTAFSPNKVWCWDITWLPASAKGLYYYLYLIIDLYSRKVVGWEVYDSESSEKASVLIKQTLDFPAFARQFIASKNSLLQT